MKVAILKALMWNTKQYISPSGFPAKSGYAEKYGYGHEEWNNNPNWIWRRFRIFHTEATDKLFEYSGNGNLAILMIGSYNREQYALGIATNVFCNSEEEMELISEELNIYDNWKEVWKLPIVKSRFYNSEKAFLKHWKDHYKWIMWKTPIHHYHWFDKQIKLKPERISGKKKLSLMHGRFQWIAPETVIEIIHKNIPQNKRIILDWLASGEFDDKVLRQKSKLSAKTRKIKNEYGTRTGNSPPDRKYEYWVEGNRSVEPLHARLQAKFVKYLQSKGINPEENINFIDV